MRHRNCQLSIVNYPLSNAILNFTMNKHIKLILPDLLAVVAFVLLSLAYFFPAALEGRVLAQHDAVAGIGSGVEMQEYQQRTGERTRWTNALFGGMPTYQMAPSYDSTDLLKTIGDIYHLYLPGSVWLVFIMLLGFYILLRAFDFRVWMAALGAMLWAFSSYYFIIIAAGHIWKFVTLAYIPPTIAGIVLAYRGKYLWGGIVTALFLALQIQSNHIQMSYYFCFVMLFMAIAFGVDAWKKKEMPRFVKATCTLVVAAAIGACVNLSNLYHTWQYSKESMRGKSELVKADDGNQTDSGLERDYITAWSYGIGETWSLLVPNVKGGASNRGDKPMLMSDNATAMEKADPQFAPLYSQLTQYWGEQPGTSGPVYVGAFVLMLFVLGCFIVKGPMKWALVAATVLSILLSWGKNFMGFTDFFIDYVPMYSKFRTVASILVIAEFTIPLLAMMALREIFLRPQLIREQFKPFVASFLLTGGVAFLFAIMPTVFFSSFISSAEMGALQSSLPSEYVAPIISNLTDMRVAMFTADAWRSFFVVLIYTFLGVILGGLAGYFGKWVDMIIMRIVDILNCIPSLPILLIIGAILDGLQVDKSVQIYYMMGFLTLLSWTGVARLVRGQLLFLREQEYIVAAEALGMGPMRKIFRHLIPNVMPQLIVSMTLGLGSIILYEASLSFLGLGVPVEMASWGQMVQRATKSVDILTYYFNDWGPAGFMIILAVLSFNFVGDGLRDALDPKMKR